MKVKFCIDCEIRFRKNLRHARFLRCQICIDYRDWENTVKFFNTMEFKPVSIIPNKFASNYPPYETNTTN